MSKQLSITLNFDMDGTIANLYGVPNWLPLLRAEDPTPYLEAKPLVNLSALARRLNTLQKEGYNLAIISWLSKEPSPTYDKAVTEAKLEWLKRHLPSVHWDRITIVAHGTPKQNYCRNTLDVLFDDEAKNRNAWTGRAYDVQNILEILKKL